jgi:hypothetical protein
LEGAEIMIGRKEVIGAAGAVALIAATLATAPAAVAECAGRYYVGEATGFFRTTTSIAARSDWRSQVRRREGGEFGLWSRARNRFTRCSKPESGGRWYCRAVARPCDERY